jgi:hypothetical protein
MVRMSLSLIEAEARLRLHANLPTVQIVERLYEVLCTRPHRLSSVTRIASILRALANASTLARSGARILDTRCCFLEDGHDLVASALGERPQVPFLALARLIVGRDTAIDGELSQLNSSRLRWQ